ncbi:anti-sigma factor antagonist [Hymenobacter sp. BT664]|uniref:Anti-sigma factor antagonist n=1 Tax=Hymenobacter montanus TaxID=2771359 RepID=A0A927BHJ7_9BACT|nr:anti-sigma factor antagonist [Hymenobacter montanus]MBD2770269.1 anti-sigma factor antagonist [Hymenobacter montanus]
MLVVHHEALPEGYLLVLAPDPASPSVVELAHHLGRACGSGKPVVWVNCRLLDAVSSLTAQLLQACHHRLHQQRGQLVLCRVSEHLAQSLRQAFHQTQTNASAGPTYPLDGTAPPTGPAE